MTAGVMPVIAPVVTAAGYAVLAARERRGRGWPARRTASFVGGSLLVAVVLSPTADALADRDFGEHMAQHLLLGMVAPLALVQGAPVTLLLRSLPHRHARRLGRLLRTRALRVVTNAWVALLLSIGGLLALYFTPVYSVSAEHPTVHALVHLHVLLAGSLFAWVVAGPDPAPGRAGVPTRLAVLGVAIAVHASAAQLVYAGILVQVHEPAAQLRAAGSLMYFGGDLAEVALALALLVTWRGRPSRARQVAHRTAEARG